MKNTSQSSNDRPDAQVLFHTSDGLSFETKALVGFHTHHLLESAAAECQLHFEGLEIEHSSDSQLNGFRWSDVLKKMDVVELRLRDRAGTQWREFFGVLWSIEDDEGEEMGFAVQRTILTIKNIGFLLERYKIFFHPQLSFDKYTDHHKKGLGSPIFSDGKPAQGRPDEIVLAVLDWFFGSEYEMELSIGRRVRDFMDVHLSSIEDSMDKLMTSLGSQNISVWEAMKKFADLPWNELFAFTEADLQKKQNAPFQLYLRPTPFDDKEWQKLKEQKGWVYQYSKKERLGVQKTLDTAADVFSFYMATGHVAEAGQSAMMLLHKHSKGRTPIYDTALLKKYGFQPLQRKTEFVYFTQHSDVDSQFLAAQQHRFNTKKASILDLLVKRTDQLYEWYGYEDFLRRTVPLKGRVGDDPRYGCRLGAVITDGEGYDFYTTEIQQMWQMGSPWVTHLTLERGHRPSEYARWLQRKRAT